MLFDGIEEVASFRNIGLNRLLTKYSTEASCLLDEAVVIHLDERVFGFGISSFKCCESFEPSQINRVVS